MLRWLGGVCLLVLSGCGWHRAALVTGDARSISIPEFRNDTFEYGEEERVTETVIDEFIKDGRLRVVNREADLTLAGRITRFHVQPANFDARHQAEGFTVSLEVTVNLTDNRSGEAILQDERLNSVGTFFAEQRPSERRANDVFVRLANQIISRALDGW